LWAFFYIKKPVKINKQIIKNKQTLRSRYYLSQIQMSVAFQSRSNEHPHPICIEESHYPLLRPLKATVKGSGTLQFQFVCPVGPHLKALDIQMRLPGLKFTPNTVAFHFNASQYDLLLLRPEWFKHRFCVRNFFSLSRTKPKKVAYTEAIL